MDYGTASRKLGIAMIVNDFVVDKSIGDVSVADICDRAGISRATFYRIFSDRNAVVTETSELAFRLGSGRIGDTYTWRDGLFVSFSGIELFWNLFRAARTSRTDSFVDTMGLNLHKELLKRNMAKSGTALTSRLSFQLDFYTQMEMATVAKWVLDDHPYGAEELADLLASCVPAELYSATNIPESLEPARRLDYSSFILESMKIN